MRLHASEQQNSVLGCKPILVSPLALSYNDVHMEDGLVEDFPRIVVAGEQKAEGKGRGFESDFTLPDRKQLDALRTFIGEKAYQMATGEGSKVMVTRGNVEIPRKTQEKGEKGIADERQEVMREALFAMVIDKWIVFLDLLKTSQHQPQRENLPNKILKVDFILKDDYLDLQNWMRGETKRSKAFQKKFGKQEIGGRGLFPSSTHFLRQVKELILAVDQSCQIEITPTDQQRERIYERAFREKNNVHILAAAVK